MSSPAHHELGADASSPSSGVDTQSNSGFVSASSKDPETPSQSDFETPHLLVDRDLVPMTPRRPGIPSRISNLSSSDNINPVDNHPFHRNLSSSSTLTSTAVFSSVGSDSLGGNTAYHDIHEHWYVRIIVVLVAFLHTRHHVSFRACTLLLFCIQCIFYGTGLLLASDERYPFTLQAILKRLDLDDRFTVHPLCWKCHRVFAPDAAADTLCPDCDLAIFKPASRLLFRQLTGQEAFPPPPPHLATPIQVLSSLLKDFLARPGMEQALSEWKLHEKTPGVLNKIQDGRVWQTIKGPDGGKFFDPANQSGELRLGVMYSMDWQVVSLYTLESSLIL